MISVTRPPAKSSDLNIIENVWSMLIQEIQKLGPQTAKTLEKSIKKAWSKIPQNSIQNCDLSMPTRLNLVMKSKGQLLNTDLFISRRSFRKNRLLCLHLLHAILITKRKVDLFQFSTLYVCMYVFMYVGRLCEIHEVMNESPFSSLWQPKLIFCS